MNRLLKIARSATPATDVKFQKQKYGKSGTRRFLRDVLAMANASTEGPRYIIIGIEFDSDGHKHINAVDAEDFSNKPSYQSLANEYIEPPLRIRYQSVLIDGKCAGIFEISDCQDRPYMMRIDYSEKLRRGDAYMRVNNATIKMGRRQLQKLFEKKFHDPVSADDIEVGFPGEIIHKELRLAHSDLSELPSVAANGKLQQLFKVQDNSCNSGATSLMARMTHARLYGTDDPYIPRSSDELMQEMKRLDTRYYDHDQNFLFEQHTEQVQLVVYNQGKEPIIDASLSLRIPNHDGFHVADQPPRIPNKNGFAERSPVEIDSYPSVSLRNKCVHVTTKIGNIPVGEPVTVFLSPLRICAGKNLRGKRFGIRYSLHGQNLRLPAEGKLRLAFHR